VATALGAVPGLLNSRISALQDRINELEKELAEAKAKK
jgi:uncharacterized small protein (DUF1192 family)